ncbi:MAG: hypothetical protein Q7J58_19170 [Hydrogenophaga sp.]|jgi:hypothetical protein|uniref:AAA family ATPase n=1 Tax=Hydrogenophaga sp. TaxID=1904254 RepID=UPI00271D4E9D|nr:AAA family ATPase [Hydrogenophaga sp.]MDO9571478.1 hypothetical protein [Hydrogenophaga sp.]MDP3373656.1 hypothetical protein [Hydrogenophaga sp.]
MKINPGGTLALEDIVGRDALVKDICARLDLQSVILVAERRMGKTHVLAKLSAEAPNGWVVFRRDVEGVRSAAEFVQKIVADLHPHLDKTTQFRDWVHTMVTELSGTKVGPLTLPNFQSKHWKQALCDTFDHVQDAKDLDRVVFLWDEIPWMIQNIARADAQEAMELLDVLRALRQQHAKLCMVFTGSIGLHHIVRQLKAQGYTNAPTNDMAAIEVAPLEAPDATGLANKLLKEIGLGAEGSTTAADIAHEVDGVPYYIHHVLSDIAKRPDPKAPLTRSDLHRIVRTAIQSAHDTWNLKHFEERTQDYYGVQRDACLAMLDGIAAAPTSLEVQTAINGAKASFPDIKQNDWIELVRLLERDHYLLRDPDTGQLGFKFSVLKRWWQWHRLNQPIMVEEAAS